MPRYFIIPVFLLALAGCCGCPDGGTINARTINADTINARVYGGVPFDGLPPPEGVPPAPPTQ
jgi:hypothetical protein